MVSGAGAVAAQASSIVGTWHGTSICTNLEVTPACKDEVVIYEVTARAGTRDTVDLKADKVVNGVREGMGTLVFVHDTGGRWTSDMRTPRYHGLWDFTVRGDSMTGRLIDLPGGEQVRRVAVGRGAPG